MYFYILWLGKFSSGLRKHIRRCTYLKKLLLLICCKELITQKHNFYKIGSAASAKPVSSCKANTVGATNSRVKAAINAPAPKAANAEISLGLGPFYDGVIHLTLSPDDLLGVLGLSLPTGLARGITRPRGAL